MGKRYITRRKFLDLAVAGSAAVVGGLTACSPSTNDTTADSDESESTNVVLNDVQQESTPNNEGTVAAEDANENTDESTNKSLVLIFSRADENYRVGYIETGNTMVLAQFIQQKTGADLFELRPVEPYPAEYQPCIDQALAERDRGDRPAVAALPDLSDYTTIYFGFPVWWGDLPMPVYTAIEALDWSGKTIAPFNTHEGSGDAGMFNTLAAVCEGSELLDGLTVRGTTAQNQRDEAEQLVDEWLASLEI